MKCYGLYIRNGFTGEEPYKELVFKSKYREKCEAAGRRLRSKGSVLALTIEPVFCDTPLTDDAMIISMMGEYGLDIRRNAWART